MEMVNGTAVHEGLPEMAFVIEPMSGKVVSVERGVTGYRPLIDDTYIVGKAGAEAANTNMGVTKAQAEAMLVGSLFGWHVPGANPAYYDENGKPKDRGVANA